MTRVISACVLTALLSTGCSLRPPVSPTPVQPGSGSTTVLTSALAKGADSLVTQSRRVVVKDEAAWKALWQEHAGGDTGRPVVDFAKEMIIAVFAGERTTAGYSVSIAGVSVAGKQLLVNIREGAPTGNGATAQVITSPYAMVRIPRRDEDAVFVETSAAP